MVRGTKGSSQGVGKVQTVKKDEPRGDVRSKDVGGVVSFGELILGVHKAAASAEIKARPLQGHKVGPMHKGVEGKVTHIRVSRKHSVIDPKAEKYII